MMTLTELRMADAAEKQAEAAERLADAAGRMARALERLADALAAEEAQGEPLKGQAHGNPGSQVRDGAVVVESIPPQPGFPRGTVGETVKKKGRRK